MWVRGSNRGHLGKLSENRGLRFQSVWYEAAMKMQLIVVAIAVAFLQSASANDGMQYFYFVRKNSFCCSLPFEISQGGSK